jgi:DNA-binding FrmR family transcriptional regulator
MDTHKSHPQIITRLKRADGHLRKIIQMLEEERACLDIAQQLQAVEKAIANAKKTLVHDHIDHCLDEAVLQQSDTAMTEFKEITKYL